ncbi:hypothetical protein [Sulfurimonas sp.]|uniref:hypothetical protein n=1 Tax=Sulfurimonas sp. TaxID=2022749 RepID=UPI0025F03F9A|nr:hypothetical protein [Sulfurimonas sp.]MDD5157549.1 hypothetical protein [Sulfurimonas sp.]
MIKKIKKELIYFVLVLVMLALLQHSDLLINPLSRFSLMIEKGSYCHPVIWAFGVYLIIVILRLAIKFVLFLKNRRVNQ